MQENAICLTDKYFCYIKSKTQQRIPISNSEFDTAGKQCRLTSKIYFQSEERWLWLPAVDRYGNCFTDEFFVSAKTAYFSDLSLQGIGRMMSEGLVRNGATVYISSRSKSVCETTAKELTAIGEITETPIPTFESARPWKMLCDSP